MGAAIFHNADMFEAAYEAWVRYSLVLVTMVPEDDVLLSLDAEVRTRLRQLDLILKKLTEEMDIVTPKPEEIKKSSEFAERHYADFKNGKMPIEEWVVGTSLRADKTMAETQRQVEAWEAVGLFTETFYFFAWRLREVLNGDGPYRFPHLERMRAHRIRAVRNQLLEHPERQGQNFTQGLVITNAGPVLRSREAIIDGATGEVRPSDDTVDQGLQATAIKFRDEMKLKFDKAATTALARKKT